MTSRHPWRSLHERVAADRAEARRRRTERTFTNSALWGAAGMVLGVGWALLCLSVDALDPFQLVLAAGIACAGAVRVWAGVRRWRAGGEFNLPGTPGPVLRSPPTERRGD